MIELDKKKQQECGIDKGCSLTNVTAAQCLKDGKMLVTATLPAKGSLYMELSAEKESLDKRQRKNILFYVMKIHLRHLGILFPGMSLANLPLFMIKRQSVKF